jgi:2-haloacid dehalogenase
VGQDLSSELTAIEEETAMPSRRAFVAATLAGAALSTLPASVATQGGGQSPARRRRILVFDVNETMLDINALQPHFARAFGDGQVLREWFSTLLLYSNVASLAGPYSDFGAIAGAALGMVAEARGVRLAPEDRDRILGGTRSLPAHADVRPGLERLRKEGFRMVTLTNSAPVAVEQQLKNAGLTDLFERSFSVDAVKRFKPAPEPYRHVAQELGVSIGDLRMVAAHAWDVVGAIRAGCLAAFIARPGKVLYPLGPKPDIVASDFQAVAEQILARDPAR